MFEKTVQLEKEILSNIDSLIKNIHQTSFTTNEGEKPPFPPIEKLIWHTNHLLKELLQKEDLPLPQIYQQLISQRLSSTQQHINPTHLETILKTYLL